MEKYIPPEIWDNPTSEEQKAYQEFLLAWNSDDSEYQEYYENWISDNSEETVRTLGYDSNDCTTCNVPEGHGTTVRPNDDPDVFFHTDQGGKCNLTNNIEGEADSCAYLNFGFLCYMILDTGIKLPDFDPSEATEVNALVTYDHVCIAVGDGTCGPVNVTTNWNTPETNWDGFDATIGPPIDSGDITCLVVPQRGDAAAGFVISPWGNPGTSGSTCLAKDGFVYFDLSALTTSDSIAWSEMRFYLHADSDTVVSGSDCIFIVETAELRVWLNPAGVVCGGTADVFSLTILDTTTEGGSVIGGLSEEFLHDFIDTGGGAIADGLADDFIQGSYDETMNGGVLIDGEVTFVNNIDVNGGVLIGGVADVSILKSLGVLVGGRAEWLAVFDTTTEGGSVVGGNVFQIYLEIVSAGAKLSGEAYVEYKENLCSCIPTSRVLSLNELNFLDQQIFIQEMIDRSQKRGLLWDSIRFLAQFYAVENNFEYFLTQTQFGITLDIIKDDKFFGSFSSQLHSKIQDLFDEVSNKIKDDRRLKETLSMVQELSSNC